jgi:hypothetical protein
MKGEITLEDFAAFDKAGLTHPDPVADEADTEGSECRARKSLST